MIIVSCYTVVCPISWSPVLSREWRCSWSSADRWCSNYIWVINKFIDCYGVPYIRDLTVSQIQSVYRWLSARALEIPQSCANPSLSFNCNTNEDKMIIAKFVISFAWIEWKISSHMNGDWKIVSVINLTLGNECRQNVAWFKTPKTYQKGWVIL